MKKGLFRKGLVFVIILLFFEIGFVPSTVGIIKEKITIPTIDSGGYIQDLIDNASDGDTIYIPSGTYYENIVIDKSISLIGEDKNTTIIDGGGNGDVVYISSQWVKLSGFTIQNSGTKQFDAGIDITSSYNNITDNNISNNRYGILIYGQWCKSNTIIGNNISNNWYGIESDGYSNIIHKNNFLNNYQDAFFSCRKLLKRNLWRHNYWNKPRLLPKFICGEIIITLDVSPPWDYIEIQWFNIDWNPAKQPYDI